MAKRVGLISYIATLWRRLRRRTRLGSVKRAPSMSALPTRLGADLYVIGESTPKWAILECPCRCGERIDVNLMRNRSPHWTLALKADRATLAPSLWMPDTKCGSHFFVRGNRIVWVP